MKQTLLSLTLLILLVGCSKTPPPPVEKRQELTSPTSIVLYSQRLKPSTALVNKAFKIKRYVGDLEFDSNIQGVESTTAFKLKNPISINYTFEKPYVIYQADVYALNLRLMDDTIAEHVIDTDIKDIVMYFSDKSKRAVSLQQTQDTIHTFDKKPTKILRVDVKSFFTENNLLTERIFSVLPSDTNITFSLYDPSYTDDILLETLQTRDDKAQNEALLHEVLNRDFTLYYKIRQKRSSFKIDKQSIVNMPDDADLLYADKRYKDFFATGRYLTEDGKFKILIADEVIKFENSKVKMEKQHTIIDRYSKQNIKKTTDIPDHDGFIDFSEGVE